MFWNKKPEKKSVLPVVIGAGIGLALLALVGAMMKPPEAPEDPEQ